MKNDHPEIKTLPYKIDDGDIIEYPIACTETKLLLTILYEADSWDYDFIAPILSELCERYGLDLAEYETCGGCYNAIMARWIAEDVEEALK